MKTWKLSDTRVFLVNSLDAVLKGEFLLRLNVGRYLVHVMYTFFLFAMIIWISLNIETTMSMVEENKRTIHELEIIYSQKVFEEASITRRSTVASTLELLGSQVKEPEAPAIILKLK